MHYLVWDESDPLVPETKLFCAPHESLEESVAQAKADIAYGRRVVGVFTQHPLGENGVLLWMEPIWRP